MPDLGGQSVRRRRLAAELRRLRERTGLTGDQVAERLGWSGSKISRIELSRIGVKLGDLRKLLDLYGVSPSHREDLQALAQESSRTGRLETVAAGLPANYTEYLAAENEAQSIWNWNPFAVPGLLQTEAYARVVHMAFQSMFRLPPGEAEQRIELRRVRQQLLSRDPSPDLSVVIDESVLYRKFGDEAVMREQLLRLIEISRMPNVQIRVFPLSGEHTVTPGPFSYMQFMQVHDVPLHDIVTVEHLTGSYYLEDEEQTFQYRVTFEWLAENSLTHTETRELITDTVGTTWSRPHGPGVRR
jgi:transcriptional regulator with XRE-family HTH domain